MVDVGAAVHRDLQTVVGVMVLRWLVIRIKLRREKQQNLERATITDNTLSFCPPTTSTLDSSYWRQLVQVILEAHNRIFQGTLKHPVMIQYLRFFFLRRKDKICLPYFSQDLQFLVANLAFNTKSPNTQRCCASNDTLPLSQVHKSGL